MAVHVQCARCRRPVDEPLPGGLCDECRRAADTATGTFLGDTELFAAGPPVADTVRADHAHPAVPSEPPHLKRFEILGALGRGGMGAVWKVRERATGRLFALKTLQSEAGTRAGSRFRIEAQALTRLRHPNIVEVHEIDLDEAAPYFTMELVEGGSLEERVRRDGPLAPADAAQLVGIIARAADHAHRAGVLHRDIKPSNVLLTPDGQVKVSDFGLAKRMDRADGRTSTLASLGTPGYMAPEQVSRGYGGMGPATDVYGIGATLYRLLTGRPTVDTTDKDTVVVLADITSGEVPDPRAHRPEVPAELALICRKALQKHPADRYPDAGSLADDLARWLAGQHPLGRLPSWATRTWRSAVHRWPMVAGIAGAVALVALTVATASWWRPGPAAAPTPDEVLARLRQDVRNGRAVVVPERGMPAWKHWAMAEAPMVESPVNDGACAFQAAGSSIVDLYVPDSDRYRVNIELMEVRKVSPDPAAEENLVGLVLGRQERSLPEGTRVQTFLAVRFADNIGAARLRANKGNARVQPSTVAISEVPGRTPIETAPGIPKAGSFDPVAPTAAEWRQIQADVAPDAVRVRFRPQPNAPWLELVTVTPDELNARFAELTGRLPNPAPVAFADIPYQWDPKGALGIFCRQAVVAFRNLVVEPLPAK